MAIDEMLRVYPEITGVKREADALELDSGLKPA